MTITQPIVAGYRNALWLSGRTPRPEYWIFAAFGLSAFVMLLLASPFVGLAFGLLTALPGTSAAVRRLHDTGRRGWWLLLPALAVPGWLLVWIASAAAALAVRVDRLDDDRYFLAATAVMLLTLVPCLIWLAAPSQPGPNKYGPNPNEVPQ